MSKVMRLSVLVISAVMFTNFLFTAAIGIYKAVHAYYILFSDGVSGKPGLEIVESLDLFLVAMVFLILSLGFMRLFYPEFRGIQKIALPWLKIEDFFQLKHLTWSAVLLTLLITFGTHVLRADGPSDWKMLIIPVAVLLFSASARMLKHP